MLAQGRLLRWVRIRDECQRSTLFILLFKIISSPILSLYRDNHYYRVTGTPSCGVAGRRTPHFDPSRSALDRHSCSPRKLASPRYSGLERVEHIRSSVVGTAHIRTLAERGLLPPAHARIEPD